MITVIHAPADEIVGHDDYPIRVAARQAELDWDRVSAAMASAIEAVGWNADADVRPEQQYVVVKFSSGSPEAIASRIDDFYDVVEQTIGPDAFMSLWIDFSFLP